MTRTLIIPCAGTGSRLIRSDDNPKPLTPFREGSLLSYILIKLENLVDEIVLVINPEFRNEFETAISKTLSPGIGRKIVFAHQLHALGSLDAVQNGLRVSTGESLAIVWGDQIGISSRTLAMAFEALKLCDLVVPLHLTNFPYVWFEHENHQVLEVKRSRDGDPVPNLGWADIGAFIFSDAVSKTIISSKLQFQDKDRELDFTYLVPELSRHFKTRILESDNPLELLAVNTNEQLRAAEERLP